MSNGRSTRPRPRTRQQDSAHAPRPAPAAAEGSERLLTPAPPLPLAHGDLSEADAAELRITFNPLVVWVWPMRLVQRWSPLGRAWWSQPEWCRMVWWWRQSMTPLAREVGPPCSQYSTWWTSHQATGASQPGQRQPPSRMAMAFHTFTGQSRVAVP